MIVTRSSFNSVLISLSECSTIALDCESTGLRPYHGDRLFSLILANREESYYFNFNIYAEPLDAEKILLPLHLAKLKTLLAMDKKWYIHRAQFDMSILAVEGIELGGTVHCTQDMERIVFNDHPPGTYDLASCAERRGLKKDDSVEKYIEEHDLWTWETVPGKAKREKRKHFDRVPFDLIAPYGEQDARVCYQLGEDQEKTLEKMAHDTPQHLPSVLSLLANERRLTRTTHRMERVGLRIDRPYCVRAAQYETDRAKKAMDTFRAATGRTFSASGKLFAEVFQDQRHKWKWNEPTKTGQVNPCFESDVLLTFEGDAAKAVLTYRDAKSKSDFYYGFLYHTDSNGDLHPHLNQGGTKTGRYSSSDPNFQNLTAEEGEDLEQEFVVRRAIIPRPGFVLLMPDYAQVEYRMMLDYAADIVGHATPLIHAILNGHDVHEASRLEIARFGINLPRSIVKNGNFAVLYGSGLDTLASTIRGTRDAARSLKNAIFQAAPEMKAFINQVMNTAQRMGNVINWAGRVSHCTNPEFAYAMPNALIQGGCADLVKFAMNRLDDFFLPMRSRMVLTIHDELPIECHESEVATVPKRVIEIMESIYPSKYLPMTATMEWSDKSLADKVKGYPV